MFLGYIRFTSSSQPHRMNSWRRWQPGGTSVCTHFICRPLHVSSYSAYYVSARLFLFYWDTRTDGTSPKHHARCKNKGRRGVAVAPATERFGTVAPATDSEFLGATSSLIAYLQNRINCGFIGSPVLTDSSGIQSDLIVKRWRYDTSDSGKYKARGHGARCKHSPSQNQQQQVCESEGRAPTGNIGTLQWSKGIFYI